MTDRSEIKIGGHRFPRTQFILALMKMTPQQRLNASAEKAAERYGLPLEDCQWWINHYRGVWDERTRGADNSKTKRRRA
jgi:hypothetical protein